MFDAVPFFIGCHILHPKIRAQINNLYFIQNLLTDKGGAKSLRCCRKNHIHSFRQFVHIVVFAYVIHNLEHISEYIIIFLIYIASGTIPDNFHILMAKK